MQSTVLNPSLDRLDNSFVYWKMNTLSTLLLQSPTFNSIEFHKKKHGQHIFAGIDSHRISFLMPELVPNNDSL